MLACVSSMPLLGEIEDKGEKQERKGTHAVLILVFSLKCRTFFKASRQQGGAKFSHNQRGAERQVSGEWFGVSL